jgi:polar amino acid transport system substrate-binding protein
VLLEKDLFVVDIAAGFHQNADQLRSDFNRFLEEIRSNGIYQDMVSRWMEEEMRSMPDLPGIHGDKVIRVGVVSDTGFPFTTRIEGKWLGFEIEMATRFSGWYGTSIEWVDMPFGSLLPSLVSGKIDMILASMMITEERAGQIDFSQPYYASGISIIGKKQSADTPGGGELNPKGFFGKLKESWQNNIIREKRYKLILKGLKITVMISVLAAFLGTLLGALVCMMRMSKNRTVRKLATGFIALIRGTPVLVLLMIIYYVVFASVNINPVLVAVVAFAINFAAYVSEMFRTGIESVERGQKEAGIAMGFTKTGTFWYITLPQALRQVLPVYKGEFVSLVKMTSVVGYIAVEDLTKASDIIRSRTFDAFFPLIMAAVIYILISWLLTLVLDYIEISVDPGRRVIRIRKMKQV